MLNHGHQCCNESVSAISASEAKLLQSDMKYPKEQTQKVIINTNSKM